MKNSSWRQDVLFKIANLFPGSTLVKKAVKSIRRDGLEFFIRDTVPLHLRHHARNIRMCIICGVNMYSAMKKQWPDKGRFISPRPVSSSCRKGKPSVCLITTNMSAGGAERQVAGLACALKNLGYNVRVRVLRLDRENSHYLPYLEKNNVDICVPPMPGFSDVKLMKKQGVDISMIKYLPRQLRIDAISLAAEFIRNPVDMVHCYLDWSCCYGGFAALLSGVPMIRFSWRNNIPVNFDFYEEWMPHVYRFLLQFPRIRTESNSAAGALNYAKWLDLHGEKVEVVPNGIDPAWLYSSDEKQSAVVRKTIGIAPGDPLVVAVGRLVPQKKPFDMAEVLVALRKNLISASLVHAGDGRLKDELQKYMELAGLAGNQGERAAMRLLGRRHDILEILQCSDVFLLTSAHEGMPNAVMEAMLAGLPVVATRVGGVPDLVQEGVQGYLHDVGDITGMAGSLQRLLTDPALRKRMGNAGKERVLSEFTVNNLAGRITKAYASQIIEAEK